MSIDRRRNRKIINPKRVILIACEGENKTEKYYFNNFSDRNKDYIIKYVHGNETDPVNLVKNTITDIKNYGLNLKADDVAFCVFDTDTDPIKNSQIESAKELAKKHKIKIITSNPSIELWFLLHYKYSSQYLTNEKLLEILKTHCNNYSKNYNIYSDIYPKTDLAIKNAKKLEKYQIENGKELQTVEANPHTQIYEIIEEFKK